MSKKTNVCAPMELKPPELTKANESMIPAFLKPEYFSFLPQVVNQLDPISFVKFALTCRPIYQLCFNSKEVKVPFEIKSLHFRRFQQDTLMFTVYSPIMRIFSNSFVPLHYTGTEHKFMGSVENRKKLKNYPFVFIVKELGLTDCGSDERSFEEIRSFLADFSITRIPKIRWQQWADDRFDWNVFIQFVREMCAEEVDVYAPAMAQNPPDFEEAATFLLQNMVYFGSDVCIPDQLILNASVEGLHLRNARISQDTYVKLLKRFAHSTEEMQWLIGREPFELGHQDIFKVDGVYNDYAIDDCDYEPDQLPLVKIDSWNSAYFWILRKDGSRVKCFGDRGKIGFATKKYDYRGEDYWFSDSESDDDYTDDD